MSLDCSVADDLFWKYWEEKDYLIALAIYYDADRPFWLTDEVAEYYEHIGQFQRAMMEYEYLIGEYFKIRRDFLPLPNGPPELYKLAVWFSKSNKTKAIQYLKLYLRAEEEFRTDPALCLTYKEDAVRLLYKLTAKCGKEYGNE